MGDAIPPGKRRLHSAVSKDAAGALAAGERQQAVAARDTQVVRYGSRGKAKRGQRSPKNRDNKEAPPVREEGPSHDPRVR